MDDDRYRISTITSEARNAARNVVMLWPRTVAIPSAGHRSGHQPGLQERRWLESGSTLTFEQWLRGRR